MGQLNTRAKVVLAAGGAVVILLLVGVLVTLKAQHETAKSQNARIGKLLAESQPVLDDAEPTIDELRRNLGSARRGLRRASTLADEALPLVRELERAGLEQAADRVRALIRSLEGPGGIADVSSSISELLAEVERLDLVPRTGRAFEDIRLTARRQRAVLSVQRRTLRIQSRTLESQLQALGVLRESLGVQREVLRHARSLDRKLGGTMPEPQAP